MEFVNGLEEYLGSSWLLSLLAAYIGGVLISFTPCVYPLIPITASFVSSQTSEENTSHWYAIALSLTYVAGLAMAYASLGMFAAMTGSFFGAIATNPWTLLMVGALISLFALAMLDVYTIPMPMFLAKIGSQKSSVGGFMGAFIIGLLSGLVAGPCTAPVLAVLLAYVASVGNPLYGFVLMFVFSFGMGSLLIAVGAFSGFFNKLPKSGIWMTRVKICLGLLMLAMGEYFVFQAGQQWL